jgi:hypothetical protein
MAVWGWTIIARNKRTLHWPSVDAVIEQSLLVSEEGGIVPKIVFTYTVGDHRYQRHLVVPGGAHMTENFAKSYVMKFPKDACVRVHYNPEHASQATLEPGLGRDDWFIFTIGIVATLLGTLLLLFN